MGGDKKILSQVFRFSFIIFKTEDDNKATINCFDRSPQGREGRASKTMSRQKGKERRKSNEEVGGGESTSIYYTAPMPRCWDVHFTCVCSSVVGINTVASAGIG